MKAECLVAETSAVQMVVMAGTYGNNDNVPKVTGTLQKEEKLFGGNGGNDKANRKPNTTTTPLERSVAFHKKSVVATERDQHLPYKQ